MDPQAPLLAYKAGDRQGSPAVHIRLKKEREYRLFRRSRWRWVVSAYYHPGLDSIIDSSGYGQEKFDTYERARGYFDSLVEKHGMRVMR